MEFIGLLIPIFMIFGIGFVGQKLFGFETKNLSTMALYLMSPFLVFRTFYKTHFTINHVYILLYAVVLCVVLILIVFAVGLIRGYTQKEICGMILSSVFMNNGNYGTPLVLFAFGKQALNYAVVLMIVQQLVMSTVGIYFAARGGEQGSGGFRTAFKSVIRMPMVYAAIIGGLLNICHVPIGKPMADGVGMVADAAIPTIMIILGMQLAKIPLKNVVLEKVSYSLIIRLVISPLIALLLTLILPVDSALKHIMILMAAMPSAANTTMFAVQFNTEVDFVSSSTLLSTCLSVITLPIILILLN
ncbi:AEC family transporter [Scopulibacillus cellulosilyticus]|uniref:AEC family transporter n=1 Tax=Scopulibacillus cellulosilyticus TaxID=2665665 RepID=A0ABW2PW72_9BACL